MKNVLGLTMEERGVLTDLRQRVEKEFPNWSFRLTLFGSRARGDADADSDMDVLVEIESSCISFEEKRQIRRAAGDISINSGIVLSLLIVDRQILEERGGFSIFQNIRDEGFSI